MPRSLDGALFNHSVTPVLDVTDASPVTVDATLDAAPFTSGTAVSGEGVHQLSVTATDDAGNTASLSLAFEIDTLPPAFVSVAPEDGTLTAAAEVTLTGEVAGADAVSVDGTAATLAGGSFSAGPFALAEGERTFSIVAADAAGNSATRAHRVVRDSTPPTVALSQPAAGAVLGASPVDVVGSVADPHLATVTVNGTAATVTGGTFVARNVPLAEGATSLVARATDSAGNFAEAQRTVELDTLAPAVAITDPAAGTLTPLAAFPVSGTATDPHLARVEIEGVTAQLAGGTWSAAVPLAEGANDLVATAFDQLGHATDATVTVIRDSTAPEVHITAPAEGSYLAAETVDVAGTAGDEPGIAVTVNGTPATLGAGSGGTVPWSLAAVALTEGENRLIARITDQLGNQGAHTRIVYRDTVAPELVSVDPADGALALPPTATFDVTFSEPLAAAAGGAWRLELADGTPVAAAATQAGAVLSVVPDAPLPSLAEVHLVLTTGLADPAGNALAAAATLAFTVADVEAPSAPVLTSSPPAYLCAPRLVVDGTAEPEGVVQVTGGAAGAEVRTAAEDGSFSLAVDLRPSALNHLEVTVRDRDGNRSPATVVEVVHDCTGPSVVSAERTGDEFTVVFDEAVDAASLAGAGGLSLADASGPVAGTVASLAGGTQAGFTPDATPLTGAVRLEVGSGVRDLAGNPLAFPWSEVFGADVTSSFLAGRVLDAATGRPLQGAEVVVLSSDGVAQPEPQPQQTTAEDGRFRIPVGAGTHSLVARRAGYTPVLRIVSASGGLGSDVFDPRLTLAAAPVTLGVAGGAFGDPARRGDGPALEVPPAALVADTDVAVTALDEQALPALLPYGWTPRGAVWVDLGGASLAAPAALSFPVDAADGAALDVVALDENTLQWSVVAEVTVFDGAVSTEASAGGAWAAVEADLGATAPPAPVVGAVLGSAAAPVGDEATAAAIAFAPAVVLPSQASLATVTYTLAGDAASGLAVTVSVQEELTLLDGTVRRDAPFDTDLVVYRAADGSPRSRFRLRPSPQAAKLPLEMGAEDVAVHPYAGNTVRGNVLGPLGGTVGDVEGDRVDLAAGALPEPTAVLLSRLDEGDLPLAVPAGFEFLGALDLDLSGRELAVPASLTLELGAAPASGDDGLLFEVVDLGLGGGPQLRPVAAIAPTASGWTTAAIDPQDLPWPGVRQTATYVFARRLADLAYLRGDVRDIGGGLAPGLLVSAAVDAAALEWVQLSNESGATAGRYVLPVTLGAVVATAQDLASGDAGSGAATAATAGERIDLDLLLVPTGPQVVEITPADGAVDVPPGIEPTVRFSEGGRPGEPRRRRPALRRSRPGGGDPRGAGLTGPRRTARHLAARDDLRAAPDHLAARPAGQPAGRGRLRHLHHPGERRQRRPRPQPHPPVRAGRYGHGRGAGPLRGGAGRQPGVRREHHQLRLHPVGDGGGGRVLHPQRAGFADRHAAAARGHRRAERGGVGADALPHRRRPRRPRRVAGGRLHHRRRRRSTGGGGDLPRADGGAPRPQAGGLAGAGPRRLHRAGRLRARLRRRRGTEGARRLAAGAGRPGRRRGPARPRLAHLRGRLLDGPGPAAPRRRGADHRAAAGGGGRGDGSGGAGRRGSRVLCCDHLVRSAGTVDRPGVQHRRAVGHRRPQAVRAGRRQPRPLPGDGEHLDARFRGLPVPGGTVRLVPTARHRRHGGGDQRCDRASARL